MTRSYAQRQSEFYALVFSCIAATAGIAAILLQYEWGGSAEGPSTTVTILIAVLTGSVATAAGAYVVFSRRREFESRYEAVRWDAMSDLDSRLVEQEARVISDVLPYLSRLSSFEDVSMVGPAGILFPLLENLRPDFFSHRPRLRVVLFEDDDGRDRWIGDAVGSYWKLASEAINVRYMAQSASSAVIMTEDTAFYGAISVPGSTAKGRRRPHEPWIEISGLRSGPLWIEWRDAIDRVWNLAQVRDH